MPSYFEEINSPKSTDSPNRSLQKINALLGVSSGAYVGNTNTRTGNFSAIQVLTETKFHTLTGNIADIANTTLGSAPAIPAGIIIYGVFTEVKLHSGSVIIYAQ
jgi:hypothetical protein